MCPPAVVLLHDDELHERYRLPPLMTRISYTHFNSLRPLLISCFLPAYSSHYVWGSDLNLFFRTSPLINLHCAICSILIATVVWFGSHTPWTLS